MDTGCGDGCNSYRHGDNQFRQKKTYIIKKLHPKSFRYDFWGAIQIYSIISRCQSLLNQNTLVESGVVTV